MTHASDDFLAGCYDATSMLSVKAEKTLAQVIRTRLRGSALRYIRGLTFTKIGDIISLLRARYGPVKFTIKLGGKLTTMAQSPNENVANYFDRAREIRDKLIEAYKLKNDNAIDADRKLEWDKKCAKYIIMGFDREIKTH